MAWRIWRGLRRILVVITVIYGISLIMDIINWTTDPMATDIELDRYFISDQFITQERPDSGQLITGNRPVLVVMVTYQRSGSSFLGEMFNQNQEAFEWFEPLDGLYSAIYGTQYGFNVPADIWNFSNGTKRHLPEYELEALARVTADILTCNFAQLPNEIVFHEFVEMFAVEHKRMMPYVTCVSEKTRGLQAHGRSLKQCRLCNLRLSKVCGQRFGLKPDTQQACSYLLLPELLKYTSTNAPTPHTTIDTKIAKAVKSYQKCLQPCRKRASLCLDRLIAVCEASPIRALKPVRLPMEAAQLLLQYVPDIKIIHNLRDPRGVVVSRHRTSQSFQAVYAGAPLKTTRNTNSTHNIVKEAELFCRNAYSDLKLYEQLKRLYPNNLMRVVYENYASRPIETAQAVYEFLNITMPKDVMTWLSLNTQSVSRPAQTSRNSSETSTKWQTLITDEERSKITEICADLIRTFPDIWPQS